MKLTGPFFSPLALTLLLLAGGALPPVSPASAQDPVREPVREEQVPLDESGSILRIDAELARRLGMFDRFEDLREVLLFRSNGGYVLEVVMRREGRIVRERTRLDEAAVASLRADVSARVAASAPSELIDQAGRIMLLGTSTALGVGFYGWAVPSILDVESFRWSLGLYMLTASASFFGPLAWSRDRPVTYGMANAAFWGGTRGIFHGIALHRIVAGPETDQFNTVCPDPGGECFMVVDNDSYEDARLASAMAFSLIDGIGGTIWAHRTGATAGDAHTVGISGDFGSVWGMGLGIAGGVDADDTGWWVGMLAGGAAGLVGGAALAGGRSLTWGDAETVRTGGILGGYLGAVVTDWVDAESERGLAAAMVAGSAAGTAASVGLVGGRAYTPGEGLLVDLGTLSAGLLGMGVAVLLGDTDDPTLLLTMGGVGGVAGFVATNAALEGGSGRDRTGRPGGGGGAGRGGASNRLESLRFGLYPVLDATRGGSTVLPPLGIRVSYAF